MQTELLIDPDLKAVLEFMQERMEASRLVAVASGVAAIAPLLWGQYSTEEVKLIQLICRPPI
jgi:hypothetical protein